MQRNFMIPATNHTAAFAAAGTMMAHGFGAATLNSSLLILNSNTPPPPKML